MADLSESTSRVTVLSVLHLMTESPAAADRALAQLEVDDLPDLRARHVFQAIRRIRDAELEPTALLVQEELRRMRTLDRVGEDYLVQIVQAWTPPSLLAYHVSHLLERSARRHVERHTDRPLTVVLDEARAIVERGLEGSTRPSVRSLAELLEDPELTALPEPVAWHLCHVGRVSLLAAPDKAGKSTVAGAAAAAVSGGQDFAGVFVRRGPVLMVMLDEPLGDTVRRLPRFGADPAAVHVLDFIPHGIDPVQAIADVVEQLAPRLVVIDSLAVVAALKGLEDANSSAGWTPIMDGIARIARTAGAGIILLHHATKATGRYRDSSAIGAGVDTRLEFEELPNPDDGTRSIRCKSRLNLPPVLRLRLVGDLADARTPLHYELDQGDLALETRVYAFVVAHPGCSKEDVKQGVVGRAADILASLKILHEKDAIENRGDRRSGKLFAKGGNGRERLGNGHGNGQTELLGNDDVPAVPVVGTGPEWPGNESGNSSAPLSLSTVPRAPKGAPGGTG